MSVMKRKNSSSHPRKKQRLSMTAAAEAEETQPVDRYEKLKRLLKNQSAVLRAVEIESARRYYIRLTRLNDTQLAKVKTMAKRRKARLHNELYPKESATKRTLEETKAAFADYSRACDVLREKIKDAHTALVTYLEHSKTKINELPCIIRYLQCVNDKINGRGAYCVHDEHGASIFDTNNVEIVKLPVFKAIVERFMPGHYEKIRQLRDAVAAEENALDDMFTLMQTAKDQAVEYQEDLMDVEYDIEDTKYDMEADNNETKEAVAEKERLSLCLHMENDPKQFRFLPDDVGAILQCVRRDDEALRLLADAYYEATQSVAVDLHVDYPFVLNSAVVNTNPRVPRNQIPDDVCSICYESLSPPEDAQEAPIVVKSNCNHFFHLECIDSMFGNDFGNYNALHTPRDYVDTECPMCRSSISNSELHIADETQRHYFF